MNKYKDALKIARKIPYAKNQKKAVHKWAVSMIRAMRDVA